MDSLHASRAADGHFQTNGLSTAMAIVPIGAGRPAGTAGVWSTGAAAIALFFIVVVMTLLGAGGCAERPTIWPNADPALRKTSVEFAADAAKRHPYKTDAPKGGAADGRANIDYGLDLIQVVNLTAEDWDNVEIWINKNYVVFVPRIEKGAPQVKTLNFPMLFDADGHTFPTKNTDAATQIQSVEMLRDGKMYELRTQLAD